MTWLMQYKGIRHEKLWFLSRSAVCLLSADCVLFTILADMDSMTQNKVITYEKLFIWGYQLSVNIQQLLNLSSKHCSALRHGPTNTKMLARNIHVLLSVITTIARESIGPLPSSLGEILIPKYISLTLPKYLAIALISNSPLAYWYLSEATKGSFVEIQLCYITLFDYIKFGTTPTTSP